MKMNKKLYTICVSVGALGLLSTAVNAQLVNVAVPGRYIAPPFRVATVVCSVRSFIRSCVIIIMSEEDGSQGI